MGIDKQVSLPSPLTMLAVKVSLVASLLVFSIILEHSNGLKLEVNIKPQKDCPVCDEMECLIRMCKYICGSDGKTHCSECHLKCGQCKGRIDPDVTKAFDGPCYGPREKTGQIVCAGAGESCSNASCCPPYQCQGDGAIKTCA